MNDTTSKPTRIESAWFDGYDVCCPIRAVMDYGENRIIIEPQDTECYSASDISESVLEGALDNPQGTIAKAVRDLRARVYRRA